MSLPNEPWGDPRITAYVMDQLTATETAQFEAEMQQDTMLANAVDEARRVTEKLAGFYAAMPMVTLDEARRERIAGAAVLPLNSSSADSGCSGRRIAMWAIAASVLILAVALPLWQTPDIRTAKTFAPERLSPQIIENPGVQVDAIERTTAVTSSDPARKDNSRGELKVLAAPAANAVPETPLSAESQSLRVAPAPMLKSVLSAANEPPSPPANARRAVAEQFDEARVADASENDSLLTDDMSSRLEMKASPDMGRMRSMAALPEEIEPSSTVPKDFNLRDATRASDQGTGPDSPGDKFSPLGENGFLRVSEHPQSTFSIDVDTASYAKVRSYLQNNQLPRPDAVRIEEMINYFDYEYTGPTAIDGESSDPFEAAMIATVCPWNPKHQLVRIGLQAKQLTEQNRPQCNLVFLIDTSGSMSEVNKLPLVIEGLQVLLDELQNDDRVAIVVYAGSAGLVLDSTPIEARPQILRALNQLQSGGSTNGGEGLQLAYETSREHFIENGVNRVILCSDGDFNVGMTGTDALLTEVKKQAQSGVDLTVLGFGMGNHNDAMMEEISNNAEGNYAFIDTIAEARKVLADQLTGTLVTVAKDVKIQIEFNPAIVSAYRLIGYENRLLEKEDFNDDTKDAGDIGAGHQVTALYEVVPVGVEVDAIAPPVSSLKYQARAATEVVSEPMVDDSGDNDNSKPTSTEMLTLSLRYKQPQGTESKLMTRVLDGPQTPFDQVDGDFRFAASVAAFGMQLRNSPFAGSWTFDDVIRVAESSVGSDPHGLRAELVGLVKIAKTLTVRE